MKWLILQVNLCNQTNYAQTLLNARYSVSAEERETTGSFFYFHKIKTSPKNTTKSLIDLLASTHDLQSEFE